MKIFTHTAVLWLACSSSGRFASAAEDVPATEQELERAYARPPVALPADYDNHGSLFSNAKDMVFLSQYIYQHAFVLNHFRDQDEKGHVRLDESKIVEDVLNAAVTIVNRHKKKGKSVQDAISVTTQDLAKNNTAQHTEDNVILAIHSDRADEKKSCAYAITTLHSQKRISVVFRGTSSMTDWVTDAWVSQVKQVNPVQNAVFREKIPYIYLHKGFAKSVIREESCNDQKDSNDCKVQTILAEVKTYLEEYPDYRLFVTGHSLGGALATAFGFYAAASEDEVFRKNGPVTIFSVSSPRVGDQQFLSSFKYLEEQGRLRHARIHNMKDKVAMIPYLHGSYRHVGLEIQLRPLIYEMVPLLDYPRYEGWKQKTKVAVWKRIISTADAARFHSCNLVRKRIVAAISPLSKTTLEDEYQKIWGLQSHED